MERRRTPRVESNTIARLTTLGEVRAHYPVRVADCSERGMRLEVPFALTVDQAVQIESGDVLLLAEVCYCSPAGPDKDYPYSAGVVTQQILSGLAGLHHLITAFAPEEAHDTPHAVSSSPDSSKR